MPKAKSNPHWRDHVDFVGVVGLDQALGYVNSSKLARAWAQAWGLAGDHLYR